MTTIIVAGALANKPGNGGEAWVRLSWIQALDALGFEVIFLEQIDHGSLVDELGRPAPFHESWNRTYFEAVVQTFDLGGRAALILGEGEETAGLSMEEVHARAADAKLLVNIGGHLALDEVKRRVGIRAYVDIDPGFVQLWEAAGIPGARLEGHDHYFTIGERIGTRGCPIPTLGLRWIPLRQPVVLDAWPPVPADEPARFTTVASWRGSYGPVELDGRRLGVKAHGFREFIEVPARSPGTFEIALSIHPDDGGDRKALQRHGWKVRDPARLCADPAAFRRYVQGSWAEFSVAQGVYVETACGWFSDRTVRYLASGKPVLIQDTGLTGLLPVGAGLLTFRTVKEAVWGARQILEQYEMHSVTARCLAEECFAPERALAPLLDRTGVTP